jgi:hypothetical protein
MSETSLHSGVENSGFGWNPSRIERFAQRFQAIAPYAALSVIAGIVFGTLSTHPF